MSITRAALLAAATAAAQNCSRVVRVGTFDQATPYALAPATRWFDDDRACFAYYRQPSGARALELLGRGDLDLAFMGSMPWSNAVARGAGVTAVSVLMDIKSSEGLVTCLNVRRLQDLRAKTLVAPYASTTHYILLATIVEAGIDINDVTVKTAEPREIMRLWDAGEIDGAACWGECFAHLQSTPHGRQKMPGHLLVDAGTVARWGYRTFDALVANDAFLAAEPGLVSRAAEYLDRANSDYRRMPDRLEWLPDGSYTAAVTAFANLRSTKCTSQQVRQALRQEGYPSVAAQVAAADSYALATKSQAETLFKQKAIPVDPRALPLQAFFDDAVVKPCVEINHRAGVASMVKPLTPTPPLLREPPDALAITTTVLAPQRPSDEGCAPWTYAYIRGSTATFTFSDGSTGTNAYQNGVTCVWGFEASGPCVEIDVTNLRSEAPRDRLEIYSGAGLLLATLSGRTDGPIPKIRGCVDARQPRETSEAIARTLAGDDADLGPNADVRMALYARWSTDGYDEAVIGAVEPMGFAATAVSVPVGGHPCAPGYSGALCHHKFCSGVVDLSGATSGTIRSQAAGQEYAPWSHCAWAIAARPDTANVRKRVRLTFKSLDLECNYDVLRVYRGHAVPGYNVAPPPKADTKSGDFLWATTTNPDGHELLPTLLFEGDVLITFQSDAVVQNKGFEIDWEVVEPDCSSQCVHGACRDDACVCDPGFYGVDCSIPNCFATTRLGTAPAGRLTSGASADYPPNTKCRWLVEVPSARDGASLTGLRLKFHRLDLEPIGREAVSTDRLVTEVIDPDVSWSYGDKWTSYNIRIPAIPGYSGPGVLYYKGDHATANAFGTFKQEDELTAMMPPRGDEHEDDDATVSLLFKFDSDASNPKPYGGFDLEFAAMYDDGRLYCDGRIENSTWPCDGYHDVCLDNVCTPTTPAPAPGGSKKGHSDRNTIIAIAVSAAVVGLVLCCWAGHNVLHFARRKSSLEAERAETVRAQLAAARDVVSDFQAPFATVRGDVFCGLGELLPHETLRDRGDTVVYDVAAGVERAKRDGLVFVFISHQWLGFETPDPDGTHYEATRRALGFVCEKAGVSLDRIRVWMDIVSIPQVNRSSQRLAVASLPTFASCCNAFVVVAPDATHADTGCICDSKTFRRRAWCRAELTACWARNGSDNMYYSTNSGLKPLAPNRPRDALDVFGGDLTCCAKCHPDGQPCDKELLVLPMLGLFDEIYRDRDGAKADAWAVIERRGLDKLYPKTFLWTRTADDVQTRPLFGDLIAACMASRDARAAGSKPDLRGYAPGAPGTQAVRHAHSAPPPSKRSLLRAASSRLLSPPRLLRSISTVSASSRDSSIEPTPTPAGLSPALTWHASPPSRTRPPRMVSFRHEGSGEIGDGAASPTESSAV